MRRIPKLMRFAAGERFEKLSAKQIGGVYVVMEHCHGTYAKPQQKLRQTLHFSIWVVVGSFFSRLSFP